MSAISVIVAQFHFAIRKKIAQYVESDQCGIHNCLYQIHENVENLLPIIPEKNILDSAQRDLCEKVSDHHCFEQAHRFTLDRVEFFLHYTQLFQSKASLIDHELPNHLS